MASSPAPVDALPSMEGREICHGLVKLGKKLGAGTFGAVYKARIADDAPLPADVPRDVAVKCIPYGTYDGFYMRLLRNECRYHLRLSEKHDGILKMCCVDNDSTEKIYYIVTELCEEDSLFEYFKKEKFARNDESVKDGILQLIDAVEHMHDEGIFHCDLKPENILVRKNGKLALADFGMTTDDEFEKSFKGSPSYLPPELLKDIMSPQDITLSWRDVDVWALGTILFAMVTGFLPWSSATYGQDTEYRHFCDHHGDYFASLGANLSPEANALFLALFAHDRATRLTDLAMLKEAVMNIKTFGPENSRPRHKQQSETNEIQRVMSEPIIYIDPDEDPIAICPRSWTSFPVRIMRKILNFALPTLPRDFMPAAAAASTHASSQSSATSSSSWLSSSFATESDGPETPETFAFASELVDEIPAVSLGKPAASIREVKL